MTTFCCTDAEMQVPSALAVAGRDLYRKGWRLNTKPAGRPVRLRSIPTIPRGRARYWLVLGAAAAGIGPYVAIPPTCAEVPPVLVVNLPAPMPAAAVRRALAVAVARGLQWRDVPGPYRHRACVSLRLPLRVALAEAVRSRPGSNVQEWVRAAVCA